MSEVQRAGGEQKDTGEQKQSKVTWWRCALAQGDIKAREQERLRVLEAKMQVQTKMFFLKWSIILSINQEIEDQMLCPICMERKRNMTFQCGHSGCEECIKPLDKCHMCRKPVDKPPIRQFNCSFPSTHPRSSDVMQVVSNM